MRSKQYAKKLLSLIIASVMIVTMLPVSALAAGVDDVMIEDQAETIVEEATGDEVVEEAAEVPDADETYDAAVTENIADVIEEDDVDDADAAEDELSDAVDGFKKGFDNTLVGAVGDAPKPKKRLHDNGDGTHTLSLSVTGSSSTSTSTQVDKANVILVQDTSSSMHNEPENVYYTVPSGYTPDEGRVAPTYYGTYNGNYYELRYSGGNWQIRRYGNSGSWGNYSGQVYSRSRLWAVKHALTDTNGIIDKLLEQNVAGDDEKKDVIEVALVSFDATAVKVQDFSYDKATLKSEITNMRTHSGTNWEDGLAKAKEYADAIKASQPDEKVYVIFLTDGQPTDANSNVSSYTGNQLIQKCWDESKDEARAIVTSNYTFYGLFTWGGQDEIPYLKSLVQYAYTGEGTYNTALDSAYEKYFTDAQSTTALINALQQIAHNITENVGYTDVEITDGVTAMTSSSVSASTSGTISGVKYYRGGGEYGTVDVDNGIYGTEWTNAPAATINNDGEIDWHLGENFVLEDGVTYTITFTVWPKQEAMNLVADLNNHVIAYESLTAAQKEQIHVSGSSYSLKTNTDYPTVSYRTITTTQEEGQEPVTTISDRMTSNITNPEPVGLSQSSMHAKKIWEDSLDSTQREEFAGTVTLYLKDNGHYYHKDPDTGEPVGVTLTESSNWTETDYIYIAPGILVDENSPAYDSTKPQVTWEGKTYAILEPGHEYIFEESDDNHHYELINYIHHPMVMGSDGHGNPVVRDVTFTKDGSGNITGIASVVALENHLSATNALKGGINISKKVVDVDDPEKELDVKDSFDLTVHITDAEGNKLPDKTIKVDGEDVTFNYDYRIYYGKNNPLYATSGEKHRSDHIYGTGTSFEVEDVYVGDEVRVVNIETGALFYVEENLGSDSDYDLVGVDYKIGEGTSDPSQAVAYTNDEIVIKNNQSWYPVKRNSASQVTVTNKCAPFYVYHSGVAGDGNLETVAVPKNNRTYDLTQNLTPNTLYGGYYLDYAVHKGTYADDGVKGEEGEAYNGMNHDWSATGDQVQTVNGKAMKPTPRETYYIKEVPVYYLLNYYQLNYMKTDEQRLMSMYLISAIDDLNYKETGFTITQDNEKAKVASSVTFQNAATGNKVTLKANTVFRTKGITGDGSEKDKLTYYDLTPNTKFFKADSSFSVKPYWITPDGITVNGVSTREIKIETLTRKGVTKIDK